MTATLDPVFDIAEKVIVLTGACGTIGRTLTKTLSERGARLVLVDMETAGLATLKSNLSGPVVTISSDVGELPGVQSILKTALNSFGRVDVLINSHQSKPPGFLNASAEEFPIDLWNEVLKVNLTGTFLTCREIGRQMLKQGKGSIINMASTYGVVSSNPALYEGNTFGNPVGYSAAKGGVIMLTKYLGAYWAKRGVRVNCLSPHGVLGRPDDGFEARFGSMSPMGRTMMPSEVVGAVLFLASDASSYATGANFLIEGGWTAW